jgi:hypothetical protein
MQPDENVTQLLGKWAEGDRAALDQLMPLVYNELRSLAKKYLRRERPASIREGYSSRSNPTPLTIKSSLMIAADHVG